MDTSDEPRTVHVQSPASLVERLDAIANLFENDRTELIVEAIREYLEATADSETVQELVATTYDDDQLEFETVKQLAGVKTAQRLRLLKADLEDEPLDLAAPDDIDVYDGDATAVDTAADDER
jgi:hypothetical protein